MSWVTDIRYYLDAMSASQTAIVNSVNVGAGAVLSARLKGQISGIDKRAVLQIEV